MGTKPAGDVFQVAATFYHMLTGRRVWESKPDVDIYKQILEGRIKPVRGHESSISTKVAEVILIRPCRVTLKLVTRMQGQCWRH
jgi:hypothetical protein